MEFLLAALLSCADGQWIISGIRQSELTAAIQSDMVLSVLENMPDDCTAEQYNPDESMR